MELGDMPQKKKIMMFVLLMLPVVFSLVWMIYLKVSWAYVINGERFSPIENKPLFVGLIIFTLGYLFFLGMMFSENILELFNRRRSIYRK